MLILKSSLSNVFLLVFFMGINALIGVHVVFGQSLREKFPNAYLHPHSLASATGLQALQLDDVQFRELAPLLAARLDENGHYVRPFPPEEVDRMIRERLTPEQLLLADRFIVTQFYSRMATTIEPTNERPSKWELIILDDVMDFLHLDEMRRAAISRIRSKQKTGMEKIESRQRKEVKKICEQWQSALINVLLPQQKTRYENAMGDAFEFSHRFELSFGAFERANVKKRVKTFIPFDVYQAIIYSPFRYIDAVKEPRALVAVLLDEGVRRDLRMTANQKLSLERYQKDILERMPFEADEQLNWIDQDEQDDYQRYKKMDEEAREKFSKEEDRIMAILLPEQRTRINQIWNQLMVNLTWQLVPLGFSDWRSYLELSETQATEFQKIHRHYRQMISNLGETENLEYAKHATEYRNSLQELLTESERMRLNAVFLDDVSGVNTARFQALWQELYGDDK